MRNSVIAWGVILPVYLSAQLAEDDTQVGALRSFPAQRLGYLFQHKVLPTIFTEKDFDMFAHVQYYGEGQPVDRDGYWTGLRTLQGYKFSGGQNLTILFDSYSSHDYGREGRYELNMGLGYGFTTRYLGLHGGVFSEAVIGKMKLKPANYMVASGPIALQDGGEGIDFGLDYYAYYKIWNLAKLKTIFTDRVRSEALSSSKGLAVIGGSLYDLANLDYYRFDKRWIFETSVQSAANRFTRKKFWSYWDLQLRLGVDRDGVDEYAVAGKAIIPLDEDPEGAKLELGLDYFDKPYRDNHIGAMIAYDFFELFDVMKLRVAAFHSYTPMVLEMHSTSAVFLELRVEVH